MASKLIQLEDGTLVEVEVAGDEVQQISGGFAEKVDATLNKIKPVLLKTCQPIVAAVKELRKDIDLEQVEVEVGLSFDIEGNIYVAKTNLGVNVLVRMALKKAGEGK
jgi:NTP-dependent ternary system trypsin peptidase co-occuring protein